jgi:hypothetical protein
MKLQNIVTGGGPPVPENKKLSPLESRMFALIKPVSVTGMEGTIEGGFLRTNNAQIIEEDVQVVRSKSYYEF